MSNKIVCANGWVTKVCAACGVDAGLVSSIEISATPLDVIRVYITLVANEEIERAIDIGGIETSDMKVELTTVSP
jgi:hypothetical protein